MKSIMKSIYYHYTEDGEVSFKNLSSAEEETTYDELYPLLNERQRKLFDKFVDILELRNCDLQEEIYIFGFRMGAQMILETFGVEFSDKDA